MENLGSNDPVCIIIAAGEGTRWNNYLGKPKHLIQIDGESLIARTVRLAGQFSQKIYVVAKLDEFRVSGSILFYPELNPLNHDADKFLNSASLWNQQGRTVVLYGDVYFSDDAMQRIMEFQPREWMLFARLRASKFTGKRYGECFAHSFFTEHIARHMAGLRHIVSAYAKKEIPRCGGWEHYRWMRNLPLNEYQRDGAFFEIDDWTEDFDFPKDYDLWLTLRDGRGLIAWIRRLNYRRRWRRWTKIK